MFEERKIRSRLTAMQPLPPAPEIEIVAERTPEERLVTDNEVAIAESQARVAEALGRAAESRVKRTAIKWVLRPLGVIAVTAVAGAGIAQLVPDLVDKFKSGVVHEDAQISPKNALKKIVLPNKAILVEGEGTGAAEVQTRAESDLPGIGTLFNSTIAPLTDKKTSVEREGTVSVGTKRFAISLKPYELPQVKDNAKKQYGVRAEVNIKRLFSDVNMDAALDANGDPKVNAKDDFFAFETVDGAAERGVTTADIADSGFQRDCGEMLLKVLPAGVMVHVKDEINTTAGLLKAMPDPQEKATAKVLEDMAKRPIDVKLVESYRTAGGSISTRPAKINAIKLPDATLYTNKILAKKMGKSPENVQVNQTGVCVPTGEALEQYNDLLNQSNGVGSLKDLA